MISGFDTALGEITLVLFTTLAPSGVVAFICMGLPVLGRGASVALRQRLNVFLGLPSWLHGGSRRLGHPPGQPR